MKRWLFIIQMEMVTVSSKPVDSGYRLSAFTIQYVEAVREEIVQCLTQNPDNVVGIPLVHFAAMPWDRYLASIALDGEYGDQITLQLRFSTLRFLLFPPLVQTQQQLSDSNIYYSSGTDSTWPLC